MADLFICVTCGYVTVYDRCPRGAEHKVRKLSTRKANEYVRVGHDAFKRIPEKPGSSQGPK